MEYIDDLAIVWSDLTQAWSDFNELPYADTLIAVVGGVLALTAAVQILKSGLRMLFWLGLAALGVSAIMHGTGRAPWEAPTLSELGIDDLVGPGREMSRDVLELLCGRLDGTDEEYRAALPGGATSFVHLGGERHCDVSLEHEAASSAGESVL